MKLTRHSINDRNEIVSKISNLPIRMEKDDRTCETKDPVYLYIYIYILYLDLTLPFSSILPRRTEDLEDLVERKSSTGRAIDLISSRYSFPRRWTAEA